MFSSGRDCKNFGERFCVPDATGLHPGSCRPFPYIRVRESLGVDKILTGSNP